MGRKPNPVIGEYFTRGPKLSDNSNRYPHTCKLCGENFPKGRGEVLHKHITEKCPAITPAERVNAALGFAGLTTAATAPQPRPHTGLADSLVDGVLDGNAAIPEPWSALQTLAEASRQVEVSEKGHTVSSKTASAALRQVHGDRFELQEQFTLDNPPISYDNRIQREKKDVPSVDGHDLLDHLTTEEKLEQLQAAALQPEPPGNQSNLSVAAAAAARVNHSLLDPQLTESSAEPFGTPVNTQDQEPTVSIHPGPARHQPWGEMTYMARNSATVTEAAPVTPPPNRGGVRMHTGNGLNPERRRAAFTPTRRREVQQARKMGACIRCRILRKSCGTNDPCDACTKVSKARFWQIPCIRTRLHNLLTLYSAGLVVVLAQNRVNEAKGAVRTMQNGTYICVTLFQEHASMNFLALMTPRVAESQELDGDQAEDSAHQILMIDSEKEDIPSMMEQYMKSLLPTLIENESSRFMQVVLSTARQLPSATSGILKRAIDLWGFVEILERERYWVINEQRPGEKESRPLENVPGRTQDIYNLITFQLSAAAERKANSVSEDLLGAMQRDLQSSKVAIGFDMYLAVLILLNCIEKSTWAIKVWELPTFRPGWPLQVPPESFTSQGHDLGSILKMLLSLRKAHPATIRDPAGKLSVVQSTDDQLVQFFRELDLDYDEVLSKHEHCEFAPENSRSLQFYFCGHVLLPPKQADEGANSAAHQSPAPVTPSR